MLLTTLTLFALAVAQDGVVATAPPPSVAPPTTAEPVAPQSRPESGVDVPGYAETVRQRDEAARRAAEEDLDFDTALARSSAAEPEPTVPEWAFADRARWERSRCGEGADEACLRDARNVLALARAERAANVQVERSVPAPQRCRNVWTQAADGVGGAFSRVCGDDEAAGARLLEDMRRREERTRQDAERDCVRRPETTDQGVRWTLVCGSAANRERAEDALDSLLR